MLLVHLRLADAAHARDRRVPDHSNTLSHGEVSRRSVLGVATQYNTINTTQFSPDQVADLHREELNLASDWEVYLSIANASTTRTARPNGQGLHCDISPSCPKTFAATPAQLRF